MSSTTFSGPVTSTAGFVATTGGITVAAGGVAVGVGGLTSAANPAIGTADPVAGTVATTFPTYTSVTLTDGTDTTPSATARTWARVFVPHNCTLTGIGYLIGSVGGTDKVILELKDSAGVSLANTALAGTTVGTAATMQKVAFTATVAVAGPAYYYIAATFNGTTARFRTIPVATMEAYTQITGTAASVFGTLAAITPGTTFTGDKGPIAFTY